MMESTPSAAVFWLMTDVMRILSQIEQGDPSAAEQLLPQVLTNVPIVVDPACCRMSPKSIWSAPPSHLKGIASLANANVS